jgi:hypothetical protein
MSDDPISTMLATLRARLEEYERQRREPRSSQLVTGQELFERKLERLLNDQNVSARDIEDFRDELAAAYFRSGGRDVPVDMLDAIQAKIESMRSTGTQLPRARNRGGNPGKFDWDGFYCEIIRIAAMDGIPSDRRELHKCMVDWCAENWFDQPDDSEIRKRMKRVYETPGVLPY